MTKRKKPQPKPRAERPWRPLVGPTTGVDHHGNDVGGTWFGNDRYSVCASIENAGLPMWCPPVVHLSIHTKDRRPLIDWRDLQRIKNEVIGPECEAMQLFPAQSRVFDTSNEFHLYAFLASGSIIPAGDFAPGLIVDHDPADRGGHVQRPLPDDIKPTITTEHMKRVLREQYPEDFARMYPAEVDGDTALATLVGNLEHSLAAARALDDDVDLSSGYEFVPCTYCGEATLGPDDHKCPNPDCPSHDEWECPVDRPHCRACGSTDEQNTSAGYGYSACCNKPIVNADNCHAPHAVEVQQP